MRFCALALLVLLPLQIPPAQAQEQYRYSWVDDRGHKHISDEVPAEAARYGYDVLNQYGRVVRHIEGEKTPEERAAARAAAEAHRLEREQEQRDQVLLLTYPNEQELVRVQTTQEDMITQRIESTSINMRNQLETLAELLGEAAQLQQKSEPVPAYLKDRIDEQRKIIREQREWITRTEAELEQVRSDNAATLEHYRTVKASSSKRRPARPAAAGGS